MLETVALKVLGGCKLILRLLDCCCKAFLYPFFTIKTFLEFTSRTSWDQSCVCCRPPLYCWWTQLCNSFVQLEVSLIAKHLIFKLLSGCWLAAVLASSNPKFGYSSPRLFQDIALRIASSWCVQQVSLHAVYFFLTLTAVIFSLSVKHLCSKEFILLNTVASGLLSRLWFVCSKVCLVCVCLFDVPVREKGL